MLEVSNLECVRGERRLFSNLNFLLAAGSIMQLTGPNGSGKTSLLRMICRLLTPARGEIRWQGANINSLGEEYCAVFTYVGHRAALKDELTALENLQISSSLSGADASEKDLRNVLGLLGLGGREHLPVRLLSEGQKRRAVLAHLVICDTKLWLLDEVLTALDKEAVTFVLTLIEHHLSKGGLAIVSTHQQLNLSASSFQRLELAS
ncbi:MAG TPA: cytochrome c biogenesis heme-transporting ATPase CcmA [Pyrinomonadaceae bacterium]|nr:cytochrome c biogenesis heme-transporting ATPase CcmA [Pyrinomonadaceae bacterium]